MNKRLLPIAYLGLVIAFVVPTSQACADPNNPNIDMPGFLRAAREAANYRETRRISEDEFIQLSREPGTIILDARSKTKYDVLHIAGAVNLSFSDIDIASLQKTLPDKNTRILIYCNNNFAGNQIAFASKAPSASLNISTYIALYNYGYRNVFELAPYINVKTTKLSLVPSPSADLSVPAITLAPPTPAAR